jgi:multicomponent Na+:H+ antiporter subunit G
VEEEVVMNVIIGNMIIGMGVAMVFIGMYGFYKFKDFKSKLLVSATIDTMGLITVLMGAMVQSGVSWFTLKVALILAIALVLNPVVTSKIALSAKTNEEREKLDVKEEKMEAKKEKN